MRVVVTGGQDGQVARSLVERGLAAGYEIAPVGRPLLDLAGEESTIMAAIEAARPDAIVSAAAYTAVDKAERDRDLAFRVNAHGAGAIAKSARRLGVPLVHLSTDYVFDGTKLDPYVENDPTGPASVYGASKLAGEEAVLESGADAVILRTAWVYSPFGSNFVKTMLRLADEREVISVVADQRGNPTSALDIADGVLAVIANLAAAADAQMRGTFHMTAAGEASWAEFAEAVFSASAAAGGPVAEVRPIKTVEYPTPAKRPSNSRLDSSRLEIAHGVRLAEWNVPLIDVVGRLVGQPAGERQMQQ
jgi:dTDP-4-dehydrorhamnose reductase